jgi:hypothetical protein
MNYEVAKPTWLVVGNGVISKDKPPTSILWASVIFKVSIYEITKFESGVTSNAVTSTPNFMTIRPAILLLLIYMRTRDDVIKLSQRIICDGDITEDHTPTQGIWALVKLVLPAVGN